MAVVKYSEEHEWVSVEGDIATIGITAHAAEQLGDVVFVEMPDPGREVAAGESVAVVESVKAASDVYAPVSGEVIEKNDDLDGKPEWVNEAAESDAWFFRVKLSDKSELDELMTKEEYDVFVAENG
ncbi:MAG: hypothetical protein RLZ98_3517 [Pseudomonadota bacterium]|jgi:glycine cleavage system H protein